MLLVPQMPPDSLVRCGVSWHSILLMPFLVNGHNSPPILRKLDLRGFYSDNASHLGLEVTSHLPSRTRLLALIATFSAANAAFRIALAGVSPPNVKPTAFLIILAGIVAGPLPGFVVGWLSMTISDLALGAGPWTIETSAGMAVVGLLAGLLWHRSGNINRMRLAVGGYLLTMTYDVGTALAGLGDLPFSMGCLCVRSLRPVHHGRPKPVPLWVCP